MLLDPRNTAFAGGGYFGGVRIVVEHATHAYAARNILCNHLAFQEGCAECDGARHQHADRAEQRLRADLAAFEKRARESADAYWYGAQSLRLARDDRPRIPTHPSVAAPIPRARRHSRRREPGRPSRARRRAS